MLKAKAKLFYGMVFVSCIYLCVMALYLFLRKLDYGVNFSLIGGIIMAIMQAYIMLVTLRLTSAGKLNGPLRKLVLLGNILFFSGVFLVSLGLSIFPGLSEYHLGILILASSGVYPLYLAKGEI